MERDPKTGTFRAMSRPSEPVVLLWSMVFLLAVFGTIAHEAWIAGGVLAAALLTYEIVSRRRSRRRSEATNP